MHPSELLFEIQGFEVAVQEPEAFVAVHTDK